MTEPSWMEAVARSFENGTGKPASPMEQAQALDPKYRTRDHLTLLSDRLTDAIQGVEAGEDRRMIVSMPPRSGKSQLVSVYFPVWLLSRHPSWKLMLISHNPTLAVGWGREVRRMMEEHPALGVSIAKDAGAASDWQTSDNGAVVSRSLPNQSVTGLGAKVLIIDDPMKDFATSHSETYRQAVWDWWQNNSATRLEPPSLVVIVGTRWHEDDLIGRVLSREYDGDPDDWENIVLPALAGQSDVLGREPGEPLLSPITPEGKTEALERWAKVKTTVGSYGWASLYQQRPSPARGSIFDVGWWRFWTTDPDKATEDGRIVYVNPFELTGRWIDSWDMTFKDSDSSDYVVGQRWVRSGANRYLVLQKRGRWSFTKTLSEVLDWADPDSPGGNRVNERFVEEAANGAAIINVLKDKVAGMKPVKARVSKEARARAVTPEVESGNVYFPHPTDPGNEWVTELLSEYREFPHGSHDDQVDSGTQALTQLRDESGRGGISVPGAVANGRSRTGSPALRLGTRPVERGLRRDLAVPRRR